MLFTPANVDDIRRYYINTFIKFKETGDVLYYLKHVDAYRLEGQTQNGDVLRLYLSEEFPYEVDYVLPHKSYYQLNEHAALLYRIPAKQYQRGVGPENTEIRLLTGKDEAPKVSLGFETLLPFVQKQKFLTLCEALDSKNNSSVLSPRMAFSSGKIFIDFQWIASVNNHTIKMKQPVFTNEVRNLLKHNNEVFKIETI